MWKRTVSVLAFGSCGLYGLKTYMITANSSVNAASTDPSATNVTREQRAGMTLRSAQVFFRHGARTPVRQLPFLEEVDYDPALLDMLPHIDYPVEVTDLDGGQRPFAFFDDRYKKIKLKGGCMAGQLTNIGQEQAYRLGQRLKKRYNAILPSDWNPTAIRVRSTNMNRNILTLQCVLAGMYGAQHLTQNGPVKIPVEKDQYEVLLPNWFFCEAQNENNKRVKRRLFEVPKVKEVNDRLCQIFGHNGEMELVIWRDHVAVRQAHGLHVPDFMEDLFPDLEEAAVNMMRYFKTGFPEDRNSVMRLSVGNIYNMIEENFEESRIDPKGPSVYLYATHDVTLLPMLTAINGPDDHWPGYCNDLSFELWEDKSGQHWVYISYCDQDLVADDHHKSMMRYEDFRKKLSPISVNDATYWTECDKLAQKFKSEYQQSIDTKSPADSAGNQQGV